MKLILENFRKFVNEGDDKVSKKISYLMDKEDKPQDQAVAIALDMKDRGELEEAATDYHKFIDQGYSQATAQAMASGSPEKKAQYDKLRKQGYGDSEARRFVYGRSYSAMGQR